MGLFFYTKKLHNIYRDLPTTNIIEPNKIGSIISIGDLPTTNIIEPLTIDNSLNHQGVVFFGIYTHITKSMEQATIYSLATVALNPK